MPRKSLRAPSLSQIGGLALLGLLASSPAWGQSVPAYQMGTVIPNDLAKYQRNGEIRNAVGIAGDNNGMGVNPFAATDYGQPGICSNSKPTTAGYSQICLGHDNAGNALLMANSLGGEPAHSLIIQVNGVDYNFPGNGQGNIVGPDVSTAFEIASYNNLTGTLLRQGRAQISDAMTAPVTSSKEGSAILGRSQTGYSARQIADWVFCDCTDVVSYDAVRGIGILPPSTVASASGGMNLVNGVGGYVMSQAVKGGGPYPTAVALFGMGIADVDGAAVWGLNTALSDNRGYKTSTGTGRKLFNEIDFSITSPNTQVTGLQFGGQALAQPAAATGLTFANLDGGTGTVAKWTQIILSFDGAATTFMTVGSQDAATASSLGQTMNFVYRNSANIRQFTSLNTNTTGGWNFSNTENHAIHLNGVAINTQHPSVEQNTIWLGVYGTLTATQPSQNVLFAYMDGSAVQQEMTINALGGATPILALSSSTGAGWLFVPSGIDVNGAFGVTCSGVPTALFATTGGVVTHC